VLHRGASRGTAGWQLIETRSAAADSAPETLQPEHQYVWSARYIDAPVCRDANTDTDDRCDDQRLYDLTDANANVTTLVDSAGDAVERYVYDAYGVVTIYDATWSSARPASSVDNPILFAGYYRDPETRLDHVRHRPDSAELGAWVVRDFEEYPDGMDHYEYVGSMPTFYLDPSGRWTYEED